METKTAVLRDGIYQPVLRTISARLDGPGGRSIESLSLRETAPVSPAVKLNVNTASSLATLEKKFAAKMANQGLLLAKSAQAGLEQLLEKLSVMKEVARRGAATDATSAQRMFLGLDLADSYKDYNKIASLASEDHSKVLDGSLAVPIRIERAGDPVAALGLTFFSLSAILRPFREGDQFRIQVGSGRELVYTATRSVFSPLPSEPLEIDSNGNVINQAAEDARVQASMQVIEALSFFGGNGFRTESGFIVDFDPSSLSAGSGYKDGEYRNVPLVGGAGEGALADLVVKGGAVTSAEIVAYARGRGYRQGDVLHLGEDAIGQAGMGFSVKVSETFTNLPGLAEGYPSVNGSTINFATAGLSEFIRVRSFLNPALDGYRLGTTSLTLGRLIPAITLRSFTDTRIRPLEVGQDAIVSAEAPESSGFGYLNGANAIGLPVSLTGGSGTGARGTIDLVNGRIASVELSHLGTGYKPADQLSVSFDDLNYRGNGFAAAIDTDPSTGAIQALQVSQAGSDYFAGASLTEVPVWLNDDTGSGFGASALATITNGAITKLELLRGGLNFDASSIVSLDFDVSGISRLNRFSANAVDENGGLKDSELVFSGGVLGGATLTGLENISFPLFGGSASSNAEISFTGTSSGGVLQGLKVESGGAGYKENDIVYADLSVFAGLGSGSVAQPTIDPNDGSIIDAELHFDASSGGSEGTGYLGGGSGSNVPVSIVGGSGDFAKGLAEIEGGRIVGLRVTQPGFGFSEGDSVTASVDLKGTTQRLGYRVRQVINGEITDLADLLPIDGYLEGGSADRVPILFAAGPGNFPTTLGRGYARIESGQITDLQISEPGAGYAAGGYVLPKIDLNLSSGRGFKAEIDAVSPTGELMAVKVASEGQGNGYLGGSSGSRIPLRLTATSGHGAYGFANILNGRIQSVEVDPERRGTGYALKTPQDGSGGIKNVVYAEPVLAGTGSGFTLKVAETGDGNRSQDALLFDKAYRAINQVTGRISISPTLAVQDRDASPSRADFLGVLESLDELQPVLERQLQKSKLEVQMLESQIKLFGGTDAVRTERENPSNSLRQQDNFAIKLSRMLSRAEVFADTTISILSAQITGPRVGSRS